MAAEPEGAVDDDGSRLVEGRGQHVQALPEHDGHVSTLGQGGLSDPARPASHRQVPARSQGGLPAPEASADREREEAEPYVRAAHAGSHRRPPTSPGEQWRGERLASRFASL
ncbi:hypothetical protein SY2F82_01450 [Streptomyces sp. Y2F8-2]|nr:hypothetical protein SY2F82_01450 [Streptomyces sp. Y2F8-2]